MAGNVYWLGQDGNIWYKTAEGTRNMGKPMAGGGTKAPYKAGFGDGGFDAAGGDDDGFVGVVEVDTSTWAVTTVGAALNYDETGTWGMVSKIPNEARAVLVGQYTAGAKTQTIAFETPALPPSGFIPRIVMMG